MVDNVACCNMTDYRAGVEAAVSAAMESGESSLGGVSPQRFVSGLAKDLGNTMLGISCC